MCAYPLRAKNLVCIQILRAYTGIGDAETQSPGMLRIPGDLPQVCPRPKKFKRLSTRDTLHGSRPNLRQRDPNGRTVPTPSDVLDKSASTKRCARRKKKKTVIRIPGTYSYGYGTCFFFFLVVFTCSFGLLSFFSLATHLDCRVAVVSSTRALE